MALRGVRGIAWHAKIFLGEKVRGILDLFYHVYAWKLNKFDYNIPRGNTTFYKLRERDGLIWNKESVANVFREESRW